MPSKTKKTFISTRNTVLPSNIPYINSKEVRIVDDVVPTNALDTIAKYAGQSRVPLDEAVALSKVKTNLGVSQDFKKVGMVPAADFMGDHDYYDYSKDHPGAHPMQHALHDYMIFGIHRNPQLTETVQREARRIAADPNYQKWKNTDGLREYSGRPRPTKLRFKKAVIKNPSSSLLDKTVPFPFDRYTRMGLKNMYNRVKQLPAPNLDVLE